MLRDLDFDLFTMVLPGRSVSGFVRLVGFVIFDIFTMVLPDGSLRWVC
jgi:hypothetical protein